MNKNQKIPGARLFAEAEQKEDEREAQMQLKKLCFVNHLNGRDFLKWDSAEKNFAVNLEIKAFAGEASQEAGAKEMLEKLESLDPAVWAVPKAVQKSD